MEEFIEQFGIVFPLGLFLGSVGYLWLLIVSFKANILWGLVIIFTMPLGKAGVNPEAGPSNPSIVNLIPLLVLSIFLFNHWDIAKKPFFLMLFGMGLTFLGLGLSAT